LTEGRTGFLPTSLLVKRKSVVAKKRKKSVGVASPMALLSRA
jgi:hypothetical protein